MALGRRKPAQSKNDMHRSRSARWQSSAFVASARVLALRSEDPSVTEPAGPVEGETASLLRDVAAPRGGGGCLWWVQVGCIWVGCLCGSSGD